MEIKGKGQVTDLPLQRTKDKESKNRELHQRHSIRLQDYDYTLAGAYFVTLCTNNREPLFGTIHEGQMHRNQLGDIIQESWDGLPNHYPYLLLDEFMIMPNQVHGILVLDTPDKIYQNQKIYRATSTGLPEIVQGFKTFSAKRINELRHNQHKSVWQRNYYERVIRNEKELNGIRQYIIDNPYNWTLDRENPQGQPKKPEHIWER